MVTKYVTKEKNVSTYMIVYITETSLSFFFFWVNIFALDSHLGTQKYSLP